MYEEIVEGLAKKAAAANPPKEGDYTKDGLLYCGNCHTPKQCRVENPFERGRIDIRSCICMCRAEEIKKADEERKRAEKMLRIRDMRRVGFPEAYMQNWTFDRDDNANEKVSRVMHNYVDKFEEMRKDGKGLLLYGMVGRGKTFATACVANALIDKGYPCLLTSFPRLRNTLQGMFDGRQAYIDGLNRFDLLIVDDLGSEADTEFMGEVVQSIIDTRYYAGLPLIITTNLTGEQLKHPTDIRKQRIYSRLLEICIPLEVTGKDRRINKLKDQYKGYADLLGFEEGEQ